jgi:hypothetical protein
MKKGLKLKFLEKTNINSQIFNKILEKIKMVE